MDRFDRYFDCLRGEDIKENDITVFPLDRESCAR